MPSFEETIDENVEKLWQEGQEAATEDGYIDLPDGPWQVRTITTRIEQASWDEEEWQLFVQFAEVNGKGTVPQWYSLNPDNEVGFGITMKVCKQFGYTGPLKGLREHVENEGFLDLVCDVKVQTKPGEKRDFRTVFINRVHGKAAAGEKFTPSGDPGSYTPPPDDDDIPF